MSIAFGKEDWANTRKNYDAWWSGELDRPLIHITLTGVDPDRKEPVLPFHEFASFYNVSVKPEEIVDCWDYQLSGRRFLGDGFPCMWPNFGAGVIAAFLGCDLTNAAGTTWFHPPKDLAITEIRPQYDPTNFWFKRVKDFCSHAMERWKGSVQIGMTDLGGNLDMLSAFLPGERLLLDLYDHPDDVKRLIQELSDLWWRYFHEFNNILQPRNPGYTAWAPIFSSEPYYMLQSDFCYMIGPEMFEEFVKPELTASCKKLKNAFYHLDGPGQLVHLDSLLAIPELKGIQWIPGSGAPPADQWPEVYRKIHSAGKRIQVIGDLETFDRVARQLGTAKGMFVMATLPVSEEAKALRFLDQYGV